MLGKIKTPPNVAFGQVLRELRKERQLSQESLALEAGVQRNYVSLIERGVNQPTITTIFKRAAALEVSPSAMLSLVEAQAGLSSPQMPKQR